MAEIPWRAQPSPSTAEETCKLCGTPILKGEPRAAGYHVVNHLGEMGLPSDACFYQVDMFTGQLLVEGDEGEREQARKIAALNGRFYANPDTYADRRTHKYLTGDWRLVA